MQQTHFTIAIPTSRLAFSEWYDTPQNKRIILHIALLVWTSLVALMMTILSLTATSDYRVAFYLPLCLFVILLYVATYWLLTAARHEILVKIQQDAESHIMVNEM
jgi:protein-S-isoprenylcysteine O-methyltransferase Ste14